MDLVERLDNELYTSAYGTKLDKERLNKNLLDVWNEIKNNKEVLIEATEVIKNRWKENTVKGIAICDFMLWDYKDVDPEIYKKLVDTIYKDEDIAGIRIGAPQTFLIGTFNNPNLNLTEEQKNFAVLQINNSDNIFGPFDLRYRILRNNSWNKKEKIKLLKQFYTADDCLEKIDAWEWDIVNNMADLYSGAPVLDKSNLYYYSNNELYDLYDIWSKNGIKEKVDEIIDEINFCRMIKELYTTAFEHEKQKVK